MAEQQWVQVYRTFKFDGSNISACLDWINTFPKGAAGCGGAGWTHSGTPADNTPPGTFRVAATTETIEGMGAPIFDWPPNWSCAAIGTEFFGMPAEFEASRDGYVAYAP